MREWRCHYRPRKAQLYIWLADNILLTNDNLRETRVMIQELKEVIQKFLQDKNDD